MDIMPLGSEKRLARRSRALEAARKLVGQYGYDGATMERIAEACGVATKTLYNQFGNKDRLVAAAIEELMVSVVEGAEARAPAGGLAGILAFEERQWAFYERGPSLGKEMLTALRRSRDLSVLQSRLGHIGSEFVLKCLREMRENGDLVPWSTPRSIDSVLKAQRHGLTDLWITGAVETADIRRRGLLGTCIVIYAFAQGSTQEYLRTLISTYSEPSSERPTHTPSLT